MGQKTSPMGLDAATKASATAGSATLPEAAIKAPPTARQQYPEVNAAIDRGLADVAAGRVHRRHSYAEYADIEIEE